MTANDEPTGQQQGRDGVHGQEQQGGQQGHGQVQGQGQGYGQGQQGQNKPTALPSTATKTATREIKKRGWGAVYPPLSEGKSLPEVQSLLGWSRPRTYRAAMTCVKRKYLKSEEGVDGKLHFRRGPQSHEADMALLALDLVSGFRKYGAGPENGNTTIDRTARLVAFIDGQVAKLLTSPIRIHSWRGISKIQGIPDLEGIKVLRRWKAGPVEHIRFELRDSVGKRPIFRLIGDGHLEYKLPVAYAGPRVEAVAATFQRVQIASERVLSWAARRLGCTITPGTVRIVGQKGAPEMANKDMKKYLAIIIRALAEQIGFYYDFSDGEGELESGTGQLLTVIALRAVIEDFDKRLRALEAAESVDKGASE